MGYECLGKSGNILDIIDIVRLFGQNKGGKGMLPIQPLEDYLALRAQGLTRFEAAKRLPIGFNRLFYEHLKAWGIRDVSHEEELLKGYMASMPTANLQRKEDVGDRSRFRN